MKLVGVGLVMLAAAAVLAFLRMIRIATGLLALVAAYLIAWSTLGKGLWCRLCKKFPTF
jgi:hypothetical protein